MLCSVSEMLDFNLCKVSVIYIYYKSKSFLTPCGQIISIRNSMLRICFH